MPARKQKKSMKPKRKATGKTPANAPPVGFMDAEVISVGESAWWCDDHDDPSPRMRHYVYTYEFPDPSEPPSAPPIRIGTRSRSRKGGNNGGIRNK